MTKVSNSLAVLVAVLSVCFYALPAEANPKDKWNAGCRDAKNGSYDRSMHTAAYEEGWQDCNK